MKLISNTNEPINLKTCDTENHRSRFLEYVEGVQSVSYERHSMLKVKKLARAAYPYSQIMQNMHMELNSWLEAGRRIEDWHPHFETTFILPWKIPRNIDKALLPKNKFNLVLHTSCLKYNKKRDMVGDNWHPGMWKQLVDLLYQNIHNLHIIWLGASWDKDMRLFLGDDYDMTTVVQAEAPVAVTLLKHADAVISYQSGLSIISVCEGTPTFMIYFDWLKPMFHTFCPPSSIGNPQLYMPATFSGVRIESAVEWVQGLQ